MSASVATITSKGQVTIPKEIRQALQLSKSDQVLFVVEGDRAMLIPLHRRPLASFRGALPATRPYPGQEAIRQEIQKELGDKFEQGGK